MALFKKNLCICIVICSLSCIITVYGDIYSEKLVLHWGFDKGEGVTVTDDSGSGADGIISEGVEYATGPDGLGKAVLINNGRIANDYGGALIAGTSAVTAAAWIYITGLPPSNDNAQILTVGLSSADQGRTCVSFRISPDGKLFMGGRSHKDDASIGAETADAIEMNTWVHVAGVMDYTNNTVTLYVNGQTDGPQSVPAYKSDTLTSNSGRLAVGAGTHDVMISSTCFKGRIDDVWLYNSSLSDDEIEELYTHRNTENTDFVINSFEITDADNGQKVTHLSRKQNVQAQFSTQNNTGANIPVKLFLALYDSQNILSGISFSQLDVIDTIAGNEDDILVTGMTLPDTDDIQYYTLKAYAWNSIDVPEPLCQAVEIIPKNPSESTIDARDYGAVGDGVTDNTAMLQEAIDACGETGGTLYITEGRYLTGTIRLKSRMTLYIDKSAVILGVPAASNNRNDPAVINPVAYPQLNTPTDNWNKNEANRALIYAEGVTDLTVTGGGIIDGNGKSGAWNGMNSSNTERSRPVALFIAMSENVTVDNIKIKDSAVWGLVSMEDDGLIIRNVDIDSNIEGNRDGIDICDSHNVTIENCTFSVDDDAICFKSGIGRGVKNVSVSDCNINLSKRAGGIKFGTTSYGGFSDMVFDNIIIKNTGTAGISIESVDGADIRNIVFKNIEMDKVASPIFIILGNRGRTPANNPSKIGSVDGITFKNITAANINDNLGCLITGFVKGGYTYRLKNLLFEDVNISFKGGAGSVPSSPAEYTGQYPEYNIFGRLPAYGFYVRHADGVTFKNYTISVSPSDVREAMVFSDVLPLIQTL